MALLKSIRGALALLVVTVATPALALKQPNNVTIPVGNSLQSLFNSRGEGINALNDAAAVPETFTPTCKLQFEVLQRNAGFKNGFGWYNVTGSKPPLADLHPFIACSDGVGTKKALHIKNDPAYKGGDIGFFELTGGCGTLQNHDNIFYSERKHNPDSSQQNPFIHLIIYNSTVQKKTFYFCWEDLLSGGDNDFDDLTMIVSGISCTGGGGACNTGKLGICADGTKQCQNGVLECLPLTGPSMEICDALDNDCNGTVDEGNLCPELYVCDKGTCVPKCSGGEFKCPTHLVCNTQGLCVDPACEKITCPSNTKCDGGKCVGPCDGVVCPYAQVCLAGACFDPCTKFKCDPDQVCHLGACVEKCQCAGCKAVETCQPSGLCLPTACLNKQCNKGEHCDGSGNCVDNCAGAACPKGQICQQGQCVPDPNAGAGGSTSSGNFVGGGSPVGTSTAASGAMGAGGGQSGFPETPQQGGCGCIVGEPADARLWRLALFALGIGALARRRPCR